MPPRLRAPVVFGSGLDRETGVLATQPGSFEDLRNMILYPGKAQTRKGLELLLNFTGDTVLAIQELRSERAGIVIVHDSSSGDVTVYRIDALGTAQNTVGVWFNTGIGTLPPVVITTEVYGRVFMAHAERAIGSRAQTFVYDPFAAELLSGLEADLDTSGLQPVHFYGVTRYREAYLVGWGFGTAIQDRPELVRISKPGEPAAFKPEHYLIAGDRNDIVVSCVPLATTLLVFKEGETWEITGANRATFGIDPVDPYYGCVSPRLALEVGGLCFFWSAIGPRLTAGGTVSQDAAQPLDIFGFEPESLIIEGATDRAFAGFISDVRCLFFAFGRRLYVLFLRGGLNNARWAYWELGQDVFCGGRLFAGELQDATTAPLGHPECTGVVRGDVFADVSWDNISAQGDEVVEIWRRAISVVTPNPQMTTDVNPADGIVDGWTKVEDPDHTVAFSVSPAGQNIDVTNAGTAALNESGVELVVPGVVPGTIVNVRAFRGLISGTGHIHWGFEFRDNLDAVITTVDEDDVTELFLGSDAVVLEGTAPALTDNVRIFLYAATDDAAEVISASFFQVFGTVPAVAGPWQVHSTLVNLLASQTERVGGIDQNKDYEWALRYRRGPYYTSGYESQDPTTWPESSRCQEQSGPGTPGAIPAPTLSSIEWLRTGPLAADEGVIATVLVTDSNDLEIQRKLSGDPDFIPIVVYSPPFPPGQPENTIIYSDFDLAGEGETEVEYRFRQVATGTTKVSDWTTVTQWIGPSPAPGLATDPIPFTAFTILGTTATIYVSSSSYWCNPNTNDFFTTVEIEIEGDEDGVGMVFVALVEADECVAPPPVTFGFTYVHGSLTPADEWQYRGRVKQTAWGFVDYSEWSSLSPLVTVL